MSGENVNKPADLYEFETAIRVAGYEPTDVMAASNVFSARVTVSGVEVSVRYYGRAWSESGWMTMSTGADDGYMRPTHGTTPEEAIEAAIGGTNG